MKDAESLLEESLSFEPIGKTKTFTWFTTPIGIAAWQPSMLAPSNKVFDLAILEGQEIALDLSKEEKELFSLKNGFIFLFYS